MKKIIIILICLIIIAMGVVGYFVVQDLKDKPVLPEVSGEIKEAKDFADLADVRSIKINEEARGVNRVVNVVYPSIQSFKNKSYQKYINDQITSVIFAYRDEINAIVDDDTPTSNMYTYKTSYEKYTNGDYLSLVILNDYQTGGIRTNKWKDIYNVDVRNERIIYLSDIFQPNVDYEKEILVEIKKQAEKNNYVLMNGAGLDSLKENQKFYINEEGMLIIYFDPAEIAPAKYGELQFGMPFVLEEGKFRLPTYEEKTEKEESIEKIFENNSKADDSKEEKDLLNVPVIDTSGDSNVKVSGETN